MATRQPPPRSTKIIPAPPPRAPQYVPLPPPTGRGPVEPDNSLPDAPIEAAELEPLHTIADEQRARSEEIQRMGVTAYMAQFDSRDPEAQQQSVPGVQHRKVEEYEARTGRR
jgi:hypothetical protein